MIIRSHPWNLQLTNAYRSVCVPASFPAVHVFSTDQRIALVTLKHQDLSPQPHPDLSVRKVRIRADVRIPQQLALTVRVCKRKVYQCYRFEEVSLSPNSHRDEAASAMLKHATTTNGTDKRNCIAVQNDTMNRTTRETTKD